MDYGPLCFRSFFSFPLATSHLAAEPFDSHEVGQLHHAQQRHAHGEAKQPPNVGYQVDPTKQLVLLVLDKSVVGKEKVGPGQVRSDVGSINIWYYLGLILIRCVIYSDISLVSCTNILYMSFNIILFMIKKT